MRAAGLIGPAQVKHYYFTFVLMNIGFDAKRAFFNKTGLGNYSRNLIKALLQYHPEHQYQLYTPKPGKTDLFPEALRTPGAQLIGPGGLWPPALWRTMGIPLSLRANKTDIYHGLSAELPLGATPPGTKYVVSVHDLIFMRFPELYGSFDRKIYLKKTRAACARADKVIAISEQTKRDLISFLSVAEEKIDVVYQNCDSAFGVPVAAEHLEMIRQKYRLPQKMLLCVGTIEKRKNAGVILKAMAQLPLDIHLVLVGRPTAYQAEIDALIATHDLSSRVHILHQVPFADLPALYQMAAIFVYPSIFEGFGIPVIEALNAGTPVIAATGSCLEEAGGPDSSYFDPDDEGTLCRHILSLWEDPARSAVRVQAGLQYAARFSAQRFAQDTMKVYRDL